MNRIFALIVIATFLFAKHSLAQHNIEPMLKFSDTVSHRFSGEWQYLSTDIHLLNGEQFSSLINELVLVRQERKRSGWRTCKNELIEASSRKAIINIT